jgi:hypothetical protein
VTLGENGDDTIQAETHDAPIIFDTPEENRGGCTFSWADAENVTVRALWSVDVSALPAGAELLGAELVLTVGAGGDSAIGIAAGIQLQRLLEPWEEGTSCGGLGAANWNERLPGVSWGAPGADPPSVAPEVLGRLGGPIGFGQVIALPFPPAVVTAWRETGENHGLLIRAETQDGLFWVSREGDDGQRPRLRIAYRDP